MYERSLNAAELILRNQKDPLVPVRQVWEEVVKQSQLAKFEVTTLADFTAMLEGDGRFQIIPAQTKSNGTETLAEDSETADAEMEQLGFFPENMVRLRTAPVVGAISNEGEEEVGSIRRRAFMSSAVQKKEDTIKKKALPITKKTRQKAREKKPTILKTKSVKRIKSIQSRKSKPRRRGKK